MYSAGPMERRLRISGILVILGLVVEALCLGWTRPIAFVVLACVGGALIGLGVLFFLYSLVSGVPHAGFRVPPGIKTEDRRASQL